MPFKYNDVLPLLNVSELRYLARMCRVRRNKRVKGGRIMKLKKEELIREIRRGLASNFKKVKLDANHYIESIGGGRISFSNVDDESDLVDKNKWMENWTKFRSPNIGR